MHRALCNQPGRIRKVWVFISLIAASLYNLPAIAQTNNAVTVFFNGPIFTANPAALTVEAVAIKNKRIIAVGTFEHVKSEAGLGATLVDLNGNTLLPGLIDSHNHAISGGRSLLTAHLQDNFIEADSLRKYARYAITTGLGLYGDVLYIDGLHSRSWKNIAILSEIFESPEFKSRAVLLQGSDGHTGWANKAMLKRAGIDAAFIKSLPVEERQYFGVLPGGDPNGLLAEDAFMYVDKVVPASSVKTIDALAAGLKHLNSLGITAWMDPSAGSTGDAMQNPLLLAYETFSHERKLTAHVTAVIKADANATPASQISIAKKWKSRFAYADNLSVAGFKIFADGVMEYPTQTASMVAPYRNSGLHGSRMVDPEKFRQFVIAADREGLLVHVHAIGDRAVTDALDAFEAARANNKAGTVMHSITHLQSAQPSDLSRFASLNVAASMQLLWATADVYTEQLVRPYISESAYLFMYPAKSITMNRGLVCGASDWPVSSANPWEAIHMAETRSGKDGVLNAKERMSRIEMLHAYTLGAAKAIRINNRIGSIEVGKDADFILVDRNVLTVSSKEIRETKVIWTMLGGEVIYSSKAKN
jgi:predicted amidohydrolase YtcJ